MDTLSHGLWGGLLLGRENKKDYWAAFWIGMAPDLFSFGIFTVANIVGLVAGPDWAGGPPSPNVIPLYVHELYNITHSFVTFAAVFILVYAIRKKAYWPLLAWPLHIIFDMPVHSWSFFPTPFLWPLSDFRFNGVPWSNPYIFFSNWILLGAGYIGWFFHRKRITRPQASKK